MTVMMARLRGVGGEENDLSLWTDENTTMKVRDTGNHTHYIIDSDQHSWPTHTNTHTHTHTVRNLALLRGWYHKHSG